MAGQTTGKATPKTAGVALTGRKIWKTKVKPNPQAACDWLNENPPQVGGEAFASNRSDGQVDVYYFIDENFG